MSVGPTDREKWPQVLRDVPGFNFYHDNEKRRDPRFNWPSPHSTGRDNNVYLDELGLIELKIREHIVQAVSDEGRDANLIPEPEGCTVLILATQDMYAERQELATFCEAEGCHVSLADPSSRSISQTEFAAVIENGGMVVSMLGFTPPNDHLISSFDGASHIGKEHSDHVFFWTKPDHNLAIVAQLPSETFGAYHSVLSNLSVEIMSAPMPDLQAKVSSALSRSVLPEEKGQASRKTLVRLYIDTDPLDRSVADTFAERLLRDDVRSQLRSRGIDVFTWLPVSTGDQVQTNQRFEKCVPRSEGVIIVHGRTSEESIQYKIEDILEIEAMKEGDNVGEISVAMLLGPPHDELSFRGNFEVIEQASWDQLNVPSIVKFISGLAERKNEKFASVTR